MRFRVDIVVTPALYTTVTLQLYDNTLLCGTVSVTMVTNQTLKIKIKINERLTIQLDVFVSSGMAVPWVGGEAKLVRAAGVYGTRVLHCTAYRRY